MSQRAALQAMDAAIVGAFAAAGMADAATYTPPGGGVAVPCEVMVDRNVEIFADAGADVPTRGIVVAMQLAQVPAPARGGVVAVDGEQLRLVAKVEGDESLERWEAQPA
jgi:hypothetical protein